MARRRSPTATAAANRARSIWAARAIRASASRKWRSNWRDKDFTSPDPVREPAVARRRARPGWEGAARSEEHTSELQSLMRNSYAVFCLKKKKPHLSDKY